MNPRLLECLELVNEMLAPLTADVNGEYPVGLIRVRKLLLDVLAEQAPPAPPAKDDIDGRLKAVFQRRK